MRVNYSIRDMHTEHTKFSWIHGNPVMSLMFSLLLRQCEALGIQCMNKPRNRALPRIPAVSTAAAGSAIHALNQRNWDAKSQHEKP